MILKKTFSDLQNIIGELIKPLPVHPDHLTLLSVPFAALGAYYILEQNVFGLFLIFISFAIDMLDGALARAKNLASAFGAYLDGICDRLVEFFVLLPLLFSSETFFPSLLILFFGSLMTSFSKAYADHRELLDSKIAAKLPTLLPRAERVIGIFIILCFYVFNYPILVFYGLWILAFLSIFTFVYLQYKIYKMCRI